MVGPSRRAWVISAAALAAAAAVVVPACAESTEPGRLSASALDASALDAGAGAPDASRAPVVGPADAEADAGAEQPATGDAGAAEAFQWHLPPGFPTPIVPPTNPMTAAKVELGRRLFYDEQLSGNETQSCASCHRQDLAFTDGMAQGLGSTGALHPRGSMSLANVAYAVSLTWANPLFAMGVVPEPLERQTVLPLYGDSPVELGLKSQTQIEQRLSARSDYQGWFKAAYPEHEQPITAQNIGRALAAFERTLISGRSPYDRYRYDGDDATLSEAAKRGYALFTSDRLSCSTCHAGFDLSEHVGYEGAPIAPPSYHNTGLYNLHGSGDYPEPNTGVYNVTEVPSDMGKFKVPTLRNVAVTAPYMHDGSIATLSEVIDHYAAGGRTIVSGPNAGIGSESALKDPLVHGFSVSAEERSDMLAFLESLTDEAFLSNPDFADPWQ